MPVTQIEKIMPPRVLFSAYSGYKFRYKDVPADYSEVYVYATSKGIQSIKIRCPESKKTPNLFVLECDEKLILISEGNIVPDEQLFVDIWNLPEWYAKEFVTKLKDKIL